MPASNEQQAFLRDLDKKLWTAADRLRANLDAVYKHAVLGLIFLKYVSDSFETHRKELVAHFTDEKDEYFLGTEPDPDVLAEELEKRDYYIEKNVFWPAHRRHARRHRAGEPEPSGDARAHGSGAFTPLPWAPAVSSSRARAGAKWRQPAEGCPQGERSEAISSKNTAAASAISLFTADSILSR